jgi:acyl dehydratase
VAVERFPVELGHIMTFARAIGDPNPIYYDEEYAAGTEVGSVIAPPTFVQSSVQFDPEWRLRPKPGQPWLGSGRNPTSIPPSDRPSGGTGRGLHAEQHYTYHRQLKPGDVLSATVVPGKSWEKEGRRSGKLKFTESVTEYRDQHGELVITARSVGVVTEKAVEQ